MKDKSPLLSSWLLPAGISAAIVVTYAFLLTPSSPKTTSAALPAPSVTASTEASSPPGAAGLDLVGAVKDSGGQPIASATIFIYTVTPRSGPGFL